MAILVGDVAVISVGLSCQTAHQISVHAELIGSRLGGEAVQNSTPFDWLICPPAAAARMISEWRFHPEDTAELQPDYEPYWPEMGCWFWHHRKRIETGEFASYQAHVVARLQRMRDRRRAIFLISNVQDNMPWAADVARHPFDFHFRANDIRALESALHARFAGAELWAVSCRGRHSLAPDHPRLIEIEPDAAGRTGKRLAWWEWAGDDEQWTSVFEQILT